MIKAILFDFGQTLVDSADGFRSAEKEVQAKIYQDLGLTLWEEFLAIYRKTRKDFYSHSNFSRNAMWMEVYNYYRNECDLQLLEKWENDYWKMVMMKTILFPETIRVLENLAFKYKLGLITNTQGQKTSVKHRFGQFPELGRFFKDIIVAGEEDIPPKPDPAPFLLSLKNLNVEHSEAIYVGDDWRIDICGARDAGIQPIWLQHYSVHRSWPVGDTSVQVITNLDQLLNLGDIPY